MNRRQMEIGFSFTFSLASNSYDYNTKNMPSNSNVTKSIAMTFNLNKSHVFRFDPFLTFPILAQVVQQRKINTCRIIFMIRSEFLFYFDWSRMIDDVSSEIWIRQKYHEFLFVVFKSSYHYVNHCNEMEIWLWCQQIQIDFLDKFSNQLCHRKWGKNESLHLSVSLRTSFRCGLHWNNICLAAHLCSLSVEKPIELSAWNFFLKLGRHINQRSNGIKTISFKWIRAYLCVCVWWQNINHTRKCCIEHNKINHKSISVVIHWTAKNTKRELLIGMNLYLKLQSS